MTTSSEATYGLPPEKGPLNPDRELRLRRKAELIKHYMALGEAIKNGTLSVKRFAEEQAESVLSDEAEAEYDPLTGLLNRRGFFNNFDEKLLGFRRTLHTLNKQGQTATPGCLVILDLDNFGAVNKIHGDSFGDSTLQQIAITLTEGVRPDDPISRFGGEEFLLFLGGAKLEDAVKVVERIRTTLPEDTAKNLNRFRQTATFGIAQFPEGLTEEEISIPKRRESIFAQAYNDASKAMRFAKGEGKNRTAFKSAEGRIEVFTPPT